MYSNDATENWFCAADSTTKEFLLHKAINQVRHSYHCDKERWKEVEQGWTAYVEMKRAQMEDKAQNASEVHAARIDELSTSEG